jgi:fatty acid desaturase
MGVRSVPHATEQAGVPAARGPARPGAAPPPERALLSPEERRAWSAPRRGPMLVHFLAVWAQAAGAIALYAAWPGPVTMAAGVLLVGGAQHGLALVTHEFAHYLVLPRRRRLNDAIGAWLFAGPAGLPLAIYRARHFDHHRMYSTEDDTKTLYKREYRGRRLLLEGLRSLFGIDYAGQALRTLRWRKDGLRTRGGAAALARDLVPLAGSQAAIAAVLCLVDPLAWAVLWLLPLLTVAQLFSKLRSAVEHHPLEAESGQEPGGPYYKGTAAPFARSVRASLLERLFFCKVNFCYHREHHLWPQVSYQYLPRLRRRLRERDGALGPEDTYFTTLLRFWRGL